MPNAYSTGWEYLVKSSLGSNENLILHYDFSNYTAETFSTVTAKHTGMVYNAEPANTGTWAQEINPTTTTWGFISRGTGLNSTAATTATSNFFKPYNSGDFTFSNVFVHGGNLDVDLTSCSFLFALKRKSNNAGVIFGSLEYDEYTVNNEKILEPKGYNFGVTDTSRLFFQSHGTEGPYVLLSDFDRKMTNKSVCSITVTDGREIEFTIYDYHNYTWESSFVTTPSILKDGKDTIDWFLGTAHNYFIPSLHDSSDPYYDNINTTLSGWLDGFMIFNKPIATKDLYTIGSGFISYGKETITSSPFITGAITGYLHSGIYPAGVTGSQVKITGIQFFQNSGSSKKHAYNTLINYNEYDDKRNISGYGLLNSDYFLFEYRNIRDNTTYETTGDNPFATLNLQEATTYSYDSHILTITNNTKSFSGIALYYVSGVTGFLYDEPTGYISIPLYKNLNTTLYDVSTGLIIRQDWLDQLRPDYLYRKIPFNKYTTPNNATQLKQALRDVKRKGS